MTYETKDSGERVEYDSGMHRDVATGKPRYDLVYEPMLTRWAELMGRGAEKYGERNWERANSEAERDRFKSSAWRHFVQWARGDQDEDHAAAVMFNISAYEYVSEKLTDDQKALDDFVEQVREAREQYVLDISVESEGLLDRVRRAVRGGS